MEDKKTKKGIKKMLQGLKEKIDKALQDKSKNGSCCCSKNKKDKC